jgi:hypothetical protein
MQNFLVLNVVVHEVPAGLQSVKSPSLVHLLTDSFRKLLLDSPFHSFPSIHYMQACQPYKCASELSTIVRRLRELSLIEAQLR